MIFGSNFVYGEYWAELRFMQHFGLENWFFSDWAKKLPDLNHSVSFPYLVGLWSRLSEVGVRTTFIVFTSTASLLFEELDSRIENMAKQLADIDHEEHISSAKLENWKDQYDMVCRFVEQINRVFGFFLLIITCHDFATCILDFSNILQHLDFKGLVEKIMIDAEAIFHTGIDVMWMNLRSMDIISNLHNDGKPKQLQSDPIKTCQFIHPLLRFLVILVASHMVGTKVAEFI